MGRPKGAEEVPTERKNAILELTAVGVKQKHIVKHYGIPQSTASNIVKRLKDKSGNNEMENRDRKKKLWPRSVRLLLKCAKKCRFESLRFITSEFNKCLRNP